MAHPKDHEVFPVGTVVRLKKTGEFAIITHVDFRNGDRDFQNYRGTIEGRGGPYALYHDDLELEALPPTESGSTTAL